MPHLLSLCPVTEAPQEGEVCEMTAGDRVFCVTRVNGELIVMDNVCPHRGGPLGQGLIENGCVVCPWHAWAFDVKTGRATNNPGSCARIFPTRVEDGVVQIVLD